MANPSYRASGNTEATAGGTSILAAAPSTTAVGDVLFVYYTGYSAGTFTPTPTLPSGWTLLQSDIQTGAGYTVFGYVAYFVATASGGTNFTFGSSLPATTSGYGCVAGIIGFYGQNSTPVDGSAFAVVPNGTTAASPTATASVSNDTILCLYIDNGNTGATPSLPTGLTSAVAFTDSSTGTGIRAGYAALTSSGTSPSYTSTFGETVGPSGGVFGTMFTVLVKGAGTANNTGTATSSLGPLKSSGTGTAANQNNGTAKSTFGSIATAIVATAAAAAIAASSFGPLKTSATGSVPGQNAAVVSGQLGPLASASTGTQSQGASASSALAALAGSAAQTSQIAVQQIYQASQKWKVGSWSPATLSVTCNAGDSLIVLTNQWNSDAGAAFLPTMSPGSLTTIYDPEATYLGTAEPVFAQALAAFNLAAGTYTITPPNLGGPGGDGDIYVLRVSGATGLRAYGAAEVGGGSTTTGNYTSITATLQSAAQPGDLLVAIGGTDNNTVTTTLVVSALNGWTNAAKQTDGTNSPPSSVDYTTATGGAQSVTYTWPDYASPVGEAIIIAIAPSTVTNTGTATGKLAAVSTASQGTQAQAAAATTALSPARSAAAANSQGSGIASGRMGALSASATGAQQLPAQGASNLPGLASQSIGTQAQIGTATVAFAALQSAGTGTTQAQNAGTASSTVPSVASAAIGTQAQSASASSQLGALTSSAAPGAVNLAQGSGALSPVGSSVIGAQRQVASASPVLGAIGAQAAGAAQQSAAGASALAALASQGTGSTQATNAASVLSPLQSNAVVIEITTLSANPEWQFYAAMPQRSFYAAMPQRSFYAAMPFRSFYALCTSNMATQIPSAIDPGDVKVITLDATADLPAGVTLTSVQKVEIVVTRNTDANAAAHFTSPTINTTPVTTTNASGQTVTIAAGLCVQLIASGCVDAVWYEIRVTCATTQSNNVEVLKAVLACTAS